MYKIDQEYSYIITMLDDNKITMITGVKNLPIIFKILERFKTKASTNEKYKTLVQNDEILK